MTHTEWITHLKGERKKKPDDTLLSHAYARSVRIVGSVARYRGSVGRPGLRGADMTAEERKNVLPRNPRPSHFSRNPRRSCDSSSTRGKTSRTRRTPST
jgi:hypothetical protein